MLIFFVFFFQAEDGIRVATVTGVQTCALPICGPGGPGAGGRAPGGERETDLRREPEVFGQDVAVHGVALDERVSADDPVHLIGPQARVGDRRARRLGADLARAAAAPGPEVVGVTVPGDDRDRLGRQRVPCFVRTSSRTSFAIAVAASAKMPRSCDQWM